MDAKTTCRRSGQVVEEEEEEEVLFLIAPAFEVICMEPEICLNFFFYNE